MSVETVKDQLAVLQAAIPGVRRAYAQLPRTALVDADLPLFLNFARETTYDWSNIGHDMQRDIRLYIMQLYVLPAQLGIEGEAENLVEPWIKTVVDYFRARPKLGQLQYVQEAWIEGDSGPRQFARADIPYWGVEFRLRVTEYYPRTYASLE